MSNESIDYIGFVKQSMESVLEGAASMAKDEEIQPTAFLIRHNQNFNTVEDYPFEIGIMPIMPGMSKDMFAEAIGMVVKKFEALGYIFLSEAWMSSDPAALSAMKYSSLGDLDVQKEEILLASYSGLGGSIMATRTIGNNREVGPFKINMEEAESDKKDGFGGRFVNLGFNHKDDPEYI